MPGLVLRPFFLFLGPSLQIRISGLVLLTLSAIPPSLRPNSCANDNKLGTETCVSSFQVGFFFFSLYLVAFGQGGHKPCVQAFGADQFDEENTEEKKWQSSFFNWWYMGVCGGGLLAVSLVMYIQDDIGWGLGFGIPAIAMAVALLVFILGRRSYRLAVMGDGSPFTGIAQVFVTAYRKRDGLVRGEGSDVELVCENCPESRSLAPTNQFRCLDKAAIPDELDVASCSKNKWRICTVTQVEEAKLLLRLLPIWGSCLGYAVIFAQSSTFFTKQGKTMDRYLGSSFQVPAAALQSFISLGIMLIVPFYDRIFVPIARKITSKPSGISMLQRIGIGMVISVISMVLAALVESKRLQIAKEHGLLDDPYAMVPMSFCWLIPQYLFFGMADVFTMVGLQEFFYNQMPDGLRSLGAALYLSIIGVGSFLSSAVITIVEMVSTTSGGESWFADNLNRAHLDYFYWLLAVLSGVFFCLFVCLASHYTYKRENLVL
ncbi:protein NRT1/ PTR FAMILY 5.10 isoform X2 [Amborella trichopoda]|uniref:protein NRT1/ PTR FAMILY 5.10 isoform X2 n=1 Tax=Amborella trichopoda TaxID=13333 RepID=UPI0009C05C38|nr:protein NRT1/ PTR FAMILY 5.10 isoform X2 [Amborella trichopoda]|eukprot:XP_020530674.1 protein NRT1/ PTR FAMILY 5.10 isoform X2 [Amborella trichopoda]